MHLQSTAIILATLLSAAQAHYRRPKPAVDICAGEKTAVVNFQWWINGNTHCTDDGTSISHPIEPLSGSQTTEIDQTYCYDITSASSWKVWQEKPPGSAVTCTFGIYPEYACKGEAVDAVIFPKQSNNATCTDSIIALGPEPVNDWWPSDDYGLFPFQGSKSVKLTCQCFPPPKPSPPKLSKKTYY